MQPLDLGDGLVLSPTTVADAEGLYAVVDAERGRLREWLPWLDSTPDLAAERAFLRDLEAANADGSMLHVTIRVQGAPAGLLGLRIERMHRSGEVGYWLSGRFEGHGVMTRSVRAVIDVAFAERGLHRVQLQAATANRRSRAVAERLGMAHEGTRRAAEWLYDHYVDLEMYAVLAPEWHSRPVAPAR